MKRTVKEGWKEGRKGGGREEAEERWRSRWREEEQTCLPIPSVCLPAFTCWRIAPVCPTGGMVSECAVMPAYSGGLLLHYFLM